MANPTAKEQEFLELINRMRTAPAAELALLLNSSDPDIKLALDYFKVNQNTLKAQWSKLKAVAPLAWSTQLNDAAATHNQTMIKYDQQSHHITGAEPDLAGRLTAAKYNYTSARENVYAYAKSMLHAHAGFAIDWGNDAAAKLNGGIQNPAGHRNAIMASDIREVGISVTAENNAKTKVGPLVVTQEFGNRSALNGKAWLLGVAFQDTDKDGWYDAGEGLKDVQVKVTGIKGTSFAKTINVADAGGYQELLNPGQYQVDFLRGGKVVSSKTTSINAQAPNNIKLDLVLPVTKLAAAPLSAATATTPVNTTPVATLGLTLGNNGQETSNPEGNTVLDFRTDATDNAQATDLANRMIDAKFVGVSADAAYYNYAGLYRVEDASGTVMDTDGKLYQPDAKEYLKAALRRSKTTNDGMELDPGDLQGDTTLRGGYIYAPFVVANGKVEDVLNGLNSANVYFNYKAANADGIEHFKLLGENKLGVEDTFGGGDLDFNDLIFQVAAKIG